VGFSKARVLVKLDLHGWIFLSLSFGGRKGAIAIANSLRADVILSFRRNDLDVRLSLATLRSRVSDMWRISFMMASDR
jgi:hypothetical protein